MASVALTHAWCRHCGYSLTGLPEARCPECGHAFDPANHRTFRRRPLRSRFGRWMIAVLALLAVAGIGVSAAVWWLKAQWQEEQPVIRSIISRNGIVIERSIGPRWLAKRLGAHAKLLERADIVRPSGGSDDADMALLEHLRHVRTLHIRCNFHMTDAGMMHLKNLKQLDELSISYAHVTDEGLKVLEELPRLRVLMLSEVHVTGEGFRYLHGANMLEDLEFGAGQRKISLAAVSDIPRLRCLSLQYSDLTDSDFSKLGQLPHLQELDLTSTDISDASVPTLLTLHALKYLDITGTHISPAGREEILRGLPAVRIGPTTAHSDSVAVKCLK